VFVATDNNPTAPLTRVNRAPSFTKGVDQNIARDSGAHTVSGWATDISAGPPDEAAQVLQFIVTSDNTALFSVQPAISPAGTLTYTLAQGATGAAIVTVVLRDNGGTANGGDDTSDPQTFIIIGHAPPVVSSVRVNGGNDQQRSMVTSLVVTFDTPVTLDAGAFRLVLTRKPFGDRRPIGSEVGLLVTPAAGGTSATLTFTGTGIVGGSLPDGVYTLFTDLSRVTNAAGQAGAGTHSFALHRLFGDVDRDGDVDRRDLREFMQALGSTDGMPRYRSWFDFDGDGDIGLDDFREIRRRLARRLLPRV
jgi:hypothetical protein